MPYYVYVSLQEDDKILISTMDAATGKLQPRDDVAVGGGPAPLAVNPERKVLYVGRRGNREVSSYRIDQATAGLSLMGTVSLDTDPCYLSTDRKGRFLLASYYEGAKVSVHPISEDGEASAPPAQLLDTARGAHSIQTDPSNTFAFVPHIAVRGPNAIFQFRFDEITGRLTPNSPPRVTPEEELGPRHFCFHPNGGILYSSNEQGCSITAYRFDSSSGTLAAFQTISTLPEDFAGRNSCSQIQISASGKFLYAPNRGHNSIACFSVDPSTGRLTSIGQVLSEAVPRAFGLDPTGNFLFAAGLESGRLASYRINSDTGALTPLETYVVGKRPMWVMVIELPG
jgi:6-phosphogluconolactonase